MGSENLFVSAFVYLAAAVVALAVAFTVGLFTVGFHTALNPVKRALRPVVTARIDNGAANGRTVTMNKLGGGIDHHVGTQITQDHGTELAAVIGQV